MKRGDGNDADGRRAPPLQRGESSRIHWAAVGRDATIAQQTGAQRAKKGFQCAAEATWCCLAQGT